ncbi:8223_t:CDS:2 [Ambispora gerdemannii]|uniref:8223_t:CDS:1 n=1 Tax=Ambispora gerdemannii TaxID=144530 RepID=A0A9N9C0L8_9GLOM|nr:8223_t:CDS:2 [Ambispora gerdemannii]
MNDFQQEKEKLTAALSNLKVSNDIEKANADLKKHIGAPGMGKTTFVQNLANAMGRDCQSIPLAGFKESGEYSILGDEKKPSLVAWAIKKQSSKNPVILLDELEKVEDKEIQKHLIQLFKDYKKGEKFTDKYYQTEIDLSHITFFATVNYIDDLDMELKKEIDITELPDFTSEEKEKILKMKAKEINDKYSGKKGGIISEEVIKKILQRIKEVGIRQAERALYKVEQEYIYTKNKGEKFTATENPQE